MIGVRFTKGFKNLRNFMNFFILIHFHKNSFFFQSFEKFLVTKADLEGNSDEKQTQQKALETLKRKRAKRAAQEGCERFSNRLRFFH